MFLAKLDNVSDVAVKVLHKPGGSAYDPQDLRQDFSCSRQAVKTDWRHQTVTNMLSPVPFSLLTSFEY